MWCLDVSWWGGMRRGSVGGVGAEKCCWRAYFEGDWEDGRAVVLGKWLFYSPSCQPGLLQKRSCSCARIPLASCVLLCVIVGLNAHVGQVGKWWLFVMFLCHALSLRLSRCGAIKLVWRRNEWWTSSWVWHFQWWLSCGRGEEIFNKAGILRALLYLTASCLSF